MDEANLFLNNHRTLVVFIGVFILFVLIVLPGINSYFSADSKLERKISRERRENELKMQKEERLRLVEEAKHERKIEQQNILEQKQRIRDEEYRKLSDLRKQVEQMPIYERWRQDVIEKCGNKCQICGSGENLEVHHRTSFHSILKRNSIATLEQAFECKQLWDIDNGEVLCKECHDKMESSKNRQAIIAGA